MSTPSITQRICIKEIFNTTSNDIDIENQSSGTFLYDKKLRQILSVDKSIATIIKILIANYKDDPFIQGIKWTTYAFLDVIWNNSTDVAKQIQDTLNNGCVATLRVSDRHTWIITPQDKSVNLLIGTNSSVTTYYVTNERDMDMNLEPFYQIDNQRMLRYRDQYEHHIMINENGEEVYL